MVRKRTILFTTLIFILLLSACAPAAVATPTAGNSSGTDLSGIKSYLLDKSSELTSSSKSLKEASDRYYALAEAAGFDYPALWNPIRRVHAAPPDAKSPGWQPPAYEQ